MGGRSERFFRWIRLGAVLLMALSLVLTAIPGRAAYASDSEDGKMGSIRLLLPESAEDVKMAVYQVASYDDSGFTWLSDYVESGADLSDLNNSEMAQAAAESLEDYIAESADSGKELTPAAEEKYSVDAGGMLFSGLTPGIYLAVQTDGEDSLKVQSALVPIPYSSDSAAGFIYDAVISPKYTFPGGAVILTKVNGEGTALPDAKFVLQQKVYTAVETAQEGAETGSDDNGEFFWKEFQANLVSNTKGQILITDLPLGDYRFIEKEAPEGYLLDETPVYFSITKAGTAELTEDGIYQTASGETAAISIVNKAAPTPTPTPTLTPIPTLTPTPTPTSTPTPASTPTSTPTPTPEPTEIPDISTTPEPTEIPEVSPTPEPSVTPEPSLTPEPTETPDASLTPAPTETPDVSVTPTPSVTEEVTPNLVVSKSLQDSTGRALYADDATYYVALYADEACTERVSNVQAVSLQGAVTSSVTFTGLEPGKTYYVSETDANGEVVNAGTTGQEVFAPDYPAGTAVKLENQSAGGTFAFDNTFYELPDGFYYAGTITVTKKTLMGSEAYNTDETFYAAVFEDSDYTQRVSDVIVLDMAGGNTVSQQVAVPIGADENSSITYYVTETDSAGNPIANSADLAYTVTVEGAEVTLSLDNTSGAVTITNSFEPEATPTPASGVTPGSGTPGATPDTHGTGTDDVRTGDDTPIAQTVALLVIAAVAVIVVIVYRKKRK